MSGNVHMKSTGERYLPAWTIIEREGAKIGIIGVMYMGLDEENNVRVLGVVDLFFENTDTVWKIVSKSSRDEPCGSVRVATRELLLLYCSLRGDRERGTQCSHGKYDRDGHGGRFPGGARLWWWDFLSILLQWDRGYLIAQ